MNSAVVIAVVLLCALVLAEVLRKKKLMEKARTDQEDYKVPLSDDVQRIYYDAYEKEMQNLRKEEQEPEQN